MIIWGTTGRETEIGSGRFHCPVCHGTREYRLVRAARYFTLYFIPLFETQDLGRYIKCVSCQHNFDERVLQDAPGGRNKSKRRGGKKKGSRAQEPARDQEDLLELTREELEDGTSVQESRQLLMQMGIDGGVADKLLAAATGGRTKACPRCNLSFLDGVPNCANCGQAL